MDTSNTIIFIFILLIWIRFLLRLKSEKNIEYKPYCKSEGNSKNGFKHGKWKYYYEDRKLKREGSYFEGYMNGEWIFYYNDGNIKEIQNYKKGIFDGRFISYYKNGNIKEEKNYLNGYFSGNFCTYYENGEMKQKKFYPDNWYKEKLIQNNLEDIIINVIHEKIVDSQNEKIRYKFYEFEKDKIKNMSIIPKESFKNEKLHGKCIYYYGIGRIKEKGNYVNGWRQGTWLEYDIAGRLIRRIFIKIQK